MKSYLSRTSALITCLALCVTFAGQASAGYLVQNSMTTYPQMVARARVLVRAQLTSVSNTVVDPQINDSQKFHASNNPHEDVRREARLLISQVLRDTTAANVQLGILDVLSLQQRSFEQYPEALKQGEEGFFALTLRPDGLFDIIGESRGILNSEDADGDFDRLAAEVEWIVDLYERHDTRFGEEPYAFYGELQDHLISQLSLDGTRVDQDALEEFAWRSQSYIPHFDSSERQFLGSLLSDTTSGSEARVRLLHAIGFIKPDGVEQTIVDLIANDDSTSTAAVGAWALEQYGRASGLNLLLDKYAEVEALIPLYDEEEYYGELSPVIGCARLMRAIRLTIPQAFLPGEADAHALTLSILRRNLVSNTDDELLKESLLAARDLRCTNNELNPQLMGLIDDFANGLIDEVVYQRVIVAFASTRTNESRSYLNGLKGNYGKAFDEHIELCLTMNPFTILVEYE